MSLDTVKLAMEWWEGLLQIVDCVLYSDYTYCINMSIVYVYMYVYISLETVVVFMVFL